MGVRACLTLVVVFQVTLNGSSTHGSSSVVVIASDALTPQEVTESEVTTEVQEISMSDVVGEVHDILEGGGQGDVSAILEGEDQGVVSHILDDGGQEVSNVEQCQQLNEQEQVFESEIVGSNVITENVE